MGQRVAPRPLFVGLIITAVIIGHGAIVTLVRPTSAEKALPPILVTGKPSIVFGMTTSNCACAAGVRMNSAAKIRHRFVFMVPYWLNRKNCFVLVAVCGIVTTNCPLLIVSGDCKV